MADIIVQTLKVEDEASAALERSAKASDDLAEAETRQLQAAHALTDEEKRLYASMKATEAMTRQKAKATGLTVAEVQALGRATKATAAAQASADVAHKAGAAALDDVAAATKRAAYGAKNLRFQMADIVTTIVGGMNPFVVLAQQGPDVVHAFDAGGGAAKTLRAAFGGLLAQAATLAPVLAAVGVAVGVVAVAYTEIAMRAEDARGVTGNLNNVLAEQGSIAGELTNTITNSANSWIKFTTDAAATALAIERINTAMVNVGAAIAGAETQIQSSGGKSLLATSQRVEALKRLISAENERQASGRLNFAETEKSTSQESKYRAELEKLQPVLEKKKAAYAVAKQQAGDLAEYNAELANSETILTDRTEAETRAKKAKAEADRQAAEWTRQAMEINEAYYAGIQRNIDAIRAGEEAFYAQASASSRLNDALSPLIERTNELAPVEALGRVTQLTLLLMELETRAASSAEASAALADEIQRVSNALAFEKSAQSVRFGGQSFAPADLSGILNSASSGMGAVSGSGGDVFAMLGGGASAAGGLLSAAGVAGAAAAVAPVAAVAAALGALVKLTDAIVVTSKERGQGETSIIDQGEEFLNDFFAQFAELPAALAESLGSLDMGAMSENFSNAISGFLVGLVTNAPVLIEALVRGFLLKSTFLMKAIIEAIPAVTAAVIEVWGNPQTWIDLAKAIVQAVKDVFKDTFDIRKEVRANQSATIGSAFQGLGGRLRSGAANITINGLMGDQRPIMQALRDLGARTGIGARDSRWAT